MTRQTKRTLDVSDILTGRVSLTDVHDEKDIYVLEEPGSRGTAAGAFVRGFYERARETGAGLHLAGVNGLEPAY